MTPQNPAWGDVVMPGNPLRQRPAALRAPTLAAPDPVLKAIEAHQRVIDEHDAARDALKAAERDAAQAFKDDVLESADLVAAGKAPLPPGKRTEEKARAKVREAEHRFAVASTAGHKTQQRLTETIIAAREQWLADLEALDSDAAEKFAAALADLRAAGDTLGATRGAIAWLHNVDSDRHELPNHVSVRKLKARLGNDDIGIADVLAPLQRIAEPPPEPTPLRQKRVAA